MNVTYLLTIVLPDGMDPASIADEAMAIEDDLMTNFEVVSVTPVPPPGLNQAAPEAPPLF